MKSKLISLSTMRELVVPACEVGRMVRYTGDMANTPGFGAVIAIRPAGPADAKAGMKAYIAAFEHLNGLKPVPVVKPTSRLLALAQELRRAA